MSAGQTTKPDRKRIKHFAAGFIFCLTLRMSHEGERAIGARVQDKADRAPSQWLNPLVKAVHWVTCAVQE
jgi:hypothetical protein